MAPGDRKIWENMGMRMGSDWRLGYTFSESPKRNFHPRENAQFWEGEDFARARTVQECRPTLSSPPQGAPRATLSVVLRHNNK